MGGPADLRTLLDSPALRRALLQARFRARALTSPARPLPDFLVIGGMRCGTSSLFKYLSAHPDVARPLRKEVGYLTLHHDQPLAWYRTHFPLRARSGRRRTFEATPHYLFHPLAPARAARLLP
ncbi:MAG: hypothetical protein M3276_04520, partial [Actinomycetota bacterium]|nr:hypothetical protein [Actinomycetota bacterium]